MILGVTQKKYLPSISTIGYRLPARLFHEIAPGKPTVNVERLIKSLQDFQRRTLK